MQNLEQILQQKFFIESFREGQKEIIESVLAGNDTIVFMPTGGGKSLIYQFSGVVLDGLVLVISPLISLMKDQVDKLNSLGITAKVINSTIDNYEKQMILNDISSDSGKIKFLYIAPERLNNEDFLRVMKKIKIAFIAIDEAHCISQWGHDFRPSYLKIKDLLNELKNPQVVALTATATKKVKEDIIKRLGIKKYKIFTSGFNRKNIGIIVKEISKREEKLAKILEILQKLPGNGIIYCSSVKICKEVLYFLEENKVKAGIYTGEMSANSREKSQNNFMAGKYKVIIATNAFGMGIDKKDIRFVIHFNLPGSIENYYQEIGRAGRDGKNSFGIIFGNYADVKIQEFFIESTHPDKNLILEFYNYLYKDYKIGAGKNEIFSKTLAEISEESKINIFKVASILKIFEKYNILRKGALEFQKIPKNKEVYTILLNKQNIEEIPINWEYQAILKEEAYYKLEQMKNLVFSQTCRKKFILEYFGDEEDLKKMGENCGTCDFCIESKNFNENIVEFDAFFRVLETVYDFDSRFGVTRISSYLSGIDYLEYGNDRNFASLEKYNSDFVKIIIEALIFKEFLYKTEGKYPVLCISETGKLALKKTYLLLAEQKELQFFISKKMK